MSTHCPAFPFARNDTYRPAPDNRQLRENEPVSRVELFDGREAWCLTKHEDIKQALSSDKLSADRRTDGFPELHEGGKKAKDEKPTFVNLDDPEHNVQRNMLQASFDRSAVDKLRPMFKQVVDHVIDKLLSGQKGKNEAVDFIENFATPIPTQIIYRVLGVPEEDVEKLSQDSSVRTGTSRTAAEQANQSLNKYMHNFVQKAAKHPNDGLTSKLIEEQMKSGKLSEEEVVQLSFLVLTAGNAALINSIGLGLLTLFDHPDQFEEVKKDPERLVPGTVTELLRWNTASALNSRRAVLKDTQFRGQDVKRGDAVICAVQAGDRDEDVTSKAETFDIHRRDYGLDKVLGFGFGPHRCIADYFSQVQLEVVFTQLIKRMPRIELAADERELPYSPANQNAGVLKLPVKIL